MEVKFELEIDNMMYTVEGDFDTTKEDLTIERLFVESGEELSEEIIGVFHELHWDILDYEVRKELNHRIEFQECNNVLLF